jgi:CRP-like cAMP-binding protein
MAYASRRHTYGNENREPDGFGKDARTSLKAMGFVRKKYPEQTTLVSQGEDSDRVFLIESGWGCISFDLAGGQRQILDFALKGDIVMPQSASGIALETFATQTELVVFEASARAFAVAIAQPSSVSALLVDTLAYQRALMAQHLTNVGRRSAIVRTAHLLLELETRLDRVSAATGNGYDCPLTQYDLADALGLTPIHVNRMLRELRERKFIEFRQGYVRMLDKDGVAKFADFDGNYIGG